LYHIQKLTLLSTPDSQYEAEHLNIFLEYVPGGSVAHMLSTYGALDEVLVKQFVKQVLKGLSYLHERDIIHRDIKGGNVLVDNKGGVKITDFGVSRKVQSGMLIVWDYCVLFNICFLDIKSISSGNRVSLQGKRYAEASKRFI
jgi:mitogen-activated protein kinase kinase kinase